MKKVAHISGGRTSMYMGIELKAKYGDDIELIFQNTGMEREETYEFLNKNDKAHGLNLTWIEYTKEKPFYKIVFYETASRYNPKTATAKPFDELLEKNGRYLPNREQRFCTVQLKVLTAYRYIRKEYKLKEWENYIGFRVDEPHRDRPEKRETKTITQWQKYPLFEQGISIFDIKNFWNSHNMKPLDLELPMLPNGKTVGGNCIGCFMKSEYENTMLCRTNPEMVAWHIKKEKEKGATFHKDSSWADKMKTAKTSPMFDFGVEDELLCTNDYGSCTEF